MSNSARALAGAVSPENGNRGATCPHCGHSLSPPKKQRSRPQLNRLMALCEVALHQWPSSVEFRPKNKDHLRYFLECECGFFDVEQTILIKNDATPEAISGYVLGTLKSSQDHKMFVEIDGTAIVVKRVRSIAYEKLGHIEACKLFQDMEDVLHAYGLDANQLLQERGKAA